MDTHGQWLKARLEEWTAEGLITDEAAETLRVRYGRLPIRSWTGPLFAAALFCFAAGAAFSAAGVWSALSQDQRFLLAVVPVVLSIAAAALFLLADAAARRLRRRHPAAEGEAPRREGLPVFLREGVGIFHGLAVSAAVWMVYDSFRLGGDLSVLLAAAAGCLLVMLYVLRSAGLGLLFAADAACAAWLSPGGWVDGAAWALLAAAFPFFFFLVSGRREAGGTAFAWGWVAAVLTLTFCTASAQMWQVVFFAVAASLTWLGGAALRPYGWIGAAFRFFGGAAVFAVLFVAAFGQAWRGADGSWLLWLLLVLFLGADTALLLRAAARREWLSVTAGLVPFVMAAAALLALWDGSGVSSAVLVSCFMVFLAAAVIARGLQKGRQWQIGAGLLLLLGDGAVRLMDSSLTFGQRGAFFLTAGVMAALLCLVLRPRGRKRRRGRAPLTEERGGGDDDEA